MATKVPGLHEGPHCILNKTSNVHNCSSTDPLCLKYEKVRSDVLDMWQKGIPICVEVLLTAGCACKAEAEVCCSTNVSEPTDSGFLLEQWFISINHRRMPDKSHINISQLMNAIRSQLHFSQISAWLSTHENAIKLSKNNVTYRLAVPGETFGVSQFTSSAIKHDFPTTDIGHGLSVQISLLSLPRMSEMPTVKCNKCEPILSIPFDKIQISVTKEYHLKQKDLVDDRMYTSCTLKGKHRCEDFDEFDCQLRKDNKFGKFKRVCQANYSVSTYCQPSTSKYIEKPKLCIDLTKANAFQNFERVCSSNPMSIGCSKLNSNDKRNLSPNIEQKIKNPKLELDLNYKDVNVETEKDSDLNKKQSKGDILLNAILRSCQSNNAQNNKLCSTKINETTFGRLDENKKDGCDFKCVQKFGQNCPCSCANAIKSESDNNNSSCDNRSASGDIFSNKDKAKYNVYVDNKHCDSPIPKIKYKKIRDVMNAQHNHSSLFKYKAKQKLSFHDCNADDNHSKNNKFLEDEAEDSFVIEDILKLEASVNNVTSTVDKEHNNLGIDIPSAFEQAKFRKSLDNATSMVFHSRTGLPLTSSPAPIRRGKSCFDFDSSINSVSAIGNALFSVGSDDESESDGSIVSPCSPDSYLLPKRELLAAKYCRRRHSNNLLGTFEESVLNGRLEPVSTVHGFTAELGASGSFVPKHLVVPVTVFFYNLGDNEKVSSPYLGHINLGRKGYQVPKSGTVQVTLFNPLGTVVKMFVVVYDLSDMPPNSQTFIRQRTLYMPTNCLDKNSEWGPKWLRYLIHLRFMSSKSSRIYLHSDIRMIIFRKSDLDTATAHGIDMSYELRSFTHLPTNPRYSLRK